MLIWRGLGILAPIIYAIVYFMLYGFLKLFATPHMFHGWFIYLGAVVAGVITYILGSAINAEIYQARKMYPQQSINSHSFFFISIEFWGLIFAMITLFFGFQETQKINQREAYRISAEEKGLMQFEQKVYLLDSLIQHPEINDYFLMSFTGKYMHHGRERSKNFKLPLKVTNINKTQIELFCPIDDPTTSDLEYSNKLELVNLFSNLKEDGFKTWIDKSILKQAVNRKPNTSDVNKVSISSLMATLPVSLTDIWQMQGPDFTKRSWNWKYKSHGFRLELKNTGLPTTIQKVLFNGREVTWKTPRTIGRGYVNPKYFDFSKDAIVSTEELLYIFDDQYFDPKQNKKIEIYCVDNQGKTFRFDLQQDGRELQVKKHRL